MSSSVVVITTVRRAWPAIGSVARSTSKLSCTHGCLADPRLNHTLLCWAGTRRAGAGLRGGELGELLAEGLVVALLLEFHVLRARPECRQVCLARCLLLTISSARSERQVAQLGALTRGARRWRKVSQGPGAPTRCESTTAWGAERSEGSGVAVNHAEGCFVRLHALGAR